MTKIDIQTICDKLRVTTAALLTFRRNHCLTPRRVYSMCEKPKTTFDEMRYSFAVDHNPLILLHNRRNNNNNRNNIVLITFPRTRFDRLFCVSSKSHMNAILYIIYTHQCRFPTVVAARLVRIMMCALVLRWTA